jgi:hypothetical protein
MSGSSNQQRRLIRILKALQGRELQDAYLHNASLREDLTREAAFGERNEADAVVFPEDLTFAKEQLLITLEKLRDDLKRRSQTLTSGLGFTSGSAPEAQNAGKGSVIIVPGGGATELSDIGPDSPEGIWIWLWALMRGRFYDLPLCKYAGPDVEEELFAPSVLIDAEPPFPPLYASLASCLIADGWATYLFPYDWRKDVDNPANAGSLIKLIECLAKQGSPVNLVTHSQGGVVTRKALSDMIKDDDAYVKSILGRVVQLGPANHGAFVMSFLAAGSFGQVPVVRRFQGFNALRAQRVTKTFTAFYQIMPSDPNLVPSLCSADVRDPAFWNGLLNRRIDFDRLNRAFPRGGTPWAQTIDTEEISDRITVIVGSVTSELTPGGVRFDALGRLVVDHHYDLPGDGWVPDILAILATSSAYRATRVGHIRLPMVPKVIEGVRLILNGAVGDDGEIPDLVRLQ